MADRKAPLASPAPTQLRRVFELVFLADWHPLLRDPLDLFRLSFGGANTFATAFLGSFPILFGLSFWQGLAATVLGLILGALLLAPMSLFGPINGTNNAVSSSAHLGVHGRHAASSFCAYRVSERSIRPYCRVGPSLLASQQPTRAARAPGDRSLRRPRGFTVSHVASRTP